MSTLTADLNYPSRPVTAWLARTFPNRDQWLGRLLSSVAAGEPITVSRPAPTLFGYAFEYAVGLDLAAADPYPDLLAAIPPQHKTWLLTAAGYDPEAGTERWLRRVATPVGRHHMAHLHAAAWYLAFLEDPLYRVGRTDPERSRRAVDSLMKDVSIPLRTFRAGAPAMLAFWRSYLAGTREALRRLGPVVTGPVLYPRYAAADLLAGSALIEIKTGWVDEQSACKLLDQLLAYALLAPSAGHRVTSVAAYLARYRVLIHQPLDTLAGELAGRPIDIAAAADAFLTVVRDSQPQGMPSG
jgi:hypothetical protein